MDLKINSIYSFNTRVPAILGATIRNAKLVSIMDYEMANMFMSPNVSHAAIFPYLPVGTPNNPEKYTYLLFELETGKKQAFAYPWIEESTITEKSNRVITVTVSNTVSGDEIKIRDMLLLAGFSATMTVT